MLLLSNIPQIGGSGNRNLPAHKNLKQKQADVLLGVAGELLAMAMAHANVHDRPTSG